MHTQAFLSSPKAFLIFSIFLPSNNRNNASKQTRFIAFYISIHFFIFPFWKFHILKSNTIKRIPNIFDNRFDFHIAANEVRIVATAAKNESNRVENTQLHGCYSKLSVEQNAT